MAIAAEGVSDWPQWGRDPTFHSFSPVRDKPHGPRPSEWTFIAKDRVVGSPAVVGDRVWFGSDDGFFRCVNRTTGRLLWSFAPTGGNKTCKGNECEHGLCRCTKIRSSPAVDPDSLSVVFGAYDFAIYKLSSAGKLLWRTETQGTVYGPATLHHDSHTGEASVLIGSFDGFLYRIAAHSGQILWRHALGAHGDSGWAVGADNTPAMGLVFGVSNEGGNCTSWPPYPPIPGYGGHCFAYAINLTSGKLVWRTGTGAPGGGGMLSIDGRRFIAGAWTGNLTSYNVVTGAKEWVVPLGGEIESHPALGPNGSVIFASAEESKLLVALHSVNGSEIWRYQTGKEINSSPSVTLDTVYVGSNDDYLHAVDRETGRRKWKVKTCDNVFASAAVADDGMVYIACNTETGPAWREKGKGAVYALDPAKQMSGYMAIQG